MLKHRSAQQSSNSSQLWMPFLGPSYGLTPLASPTWELQMLVIPADSRLMCMNRSRVQIHTLWTLWMVMMVAKVVAATGKEQHAQAKPPERAQESRLHMQPRLWVQRVSQICSSSAKGMNLKHWQLTGPEQGPLARASLEAAALSNIKGQQDPQKLKK